MDQFYRLELLIGKDNLSYIKNKRVVVFGVGGVGGYVVEALIRSGVSNIAVVDNDKVNITNLNRQIIATLDTLNRYKVDVIKDRILSINKDVNVETYNIFFNENTLDLIDFSKYDYVIDCIDSVKSKLLLIKTAKEKNIKIISAMGAGNKFDITKLEVSDISKTSYDPLSKIIRRELKKLGINHLKVVYSKESPYTSISKDRIIPSNAFVPCAMGLIIASEVIKDFIKENE